MRAQDFYASLVKWQIKHSTQFRFLPITAKKYCSSGMSIKITETFCVTESVNFTFIISEKLDQLACNMHVYLINFSVKASDSVCAHIYGT